MAINISNSSFLILVTSYAKGMDLKVDFISIALTQKIKKEPKKEEITLCNYPQFVSFSNMKQM
jgi:hypothetical protein